MAHMRRWHTSAAAAAVALLMTLTGAAGASAQPAARPIVVLETTMGNVTIELFPAEAPVTVENFLGYVRSGYYAGTIFHRVVRGMLVQGGGLTPQLRVKPAGAPLKNEASAKLKNERGMVAAARERGVDSATSQFFINTATNAAFDHKSILATEFGYAVFGRVIDGMDVVDKMERVKTKGRDVPQTLIMISRAYEKEPQ